MKKILSHIVIFALLVIAPVSFSTKNIPNFDIPATKTCPLQETQKLTIAVVRRSPGSASPIAVPRPEVTFFSIAQLPVLDDSHEIPQGRAPPVVLSA
ncbi:MAG: hypothetical protein M0023_13230 [Desulfobacteraceae bacterium]|nr:hypothetical protein [Desulfobacteraceae bacterium]